MPIKVKVLGNFDITEKYFNTALHITDIPKIEKIDLTCKKLYN